MSLMQHSFSSIAAEQGSLGQFSDRLQQNIRKTCNALNGKDAVCKHGD